LIKQFQRIILPDSLLKKGRNAATTKTKGIITKERLNINPKGTLDKKIKVAINKIYKPKQRNETAGVEITNNINAVKIMTFTGGSIR
jgi:predicted transcriptional regulator